MMLKKFVPKHLSIFMICFVLFIVPFFWMRPGEMDLGGDSSRLYFYDPISYLKNFSFYGVVPEGTGVAAPNYYFLPFVGMLAFVKYFVQSPYILINLFNGVKLSVAFVSMYLIILELANSSTNKEQDRRHVRWSALVASLFYILSPSIIGNFDRALLSHNQIFLNPLMFYLLLRYLLIQQNMYLWFALMTSFIFAPNFAYTSAPPLFAFYPLSITFLLLYVAKIRQQMISWWGLVVGFLVFLGLQSFHLIPQLVNLFEPGSFTNTRVFNKESIVHEGIRYFTSVLPMAKVSTNILVLPALKELTVMSILAPLIVIVGFFLNKGKHKRIILTGVFFLMTLFLVSANITSLGVEFYRRLFYIPGFTMFRNFLGQWQFVYAFFYALLFGQALSVIILKLKNLYAKVFSIAVMLLLMSGAWPFINGSLVNKVLWQSKGVRIAMRVDPRLEETLAFARSLPKEGKVLTLPLTDAYYQVLHGINNGAYVGPSMISYVAGKKDFSGYQILSPFSEEIMRYVREKNYPSFTQILSLLNIRYIFHNSDPKVYEEKFPGFPYTYMRTSLPKTQIEYQEFLSHLPLHRIYTNGSYQVYELDESVFLPEVYVPKTIISYKNGILGMTESVSAIPVSSLETAYFEQKTCDELGEAALCAFGFRPPVMYLATKNITPVRYEMTAKLQDVNGPFFLVFQNAFHRSWQLSIDGYIVPHSRHIQVNGYANAWYMLPEDIKDRVEVRFRLEMTSQRLFYVSLIVSVITLLGCILWSGQRIIKSAYEKKRTR